MLLESGRIDPFGWLCRNIANVLEDMNRRDHPTLCFQSDTQRNNNEIRSKKFRQIRYMEDLVDIEGFAKSPSYSSS